jgi:hypothetical protein
MSTPTETTDQYWVYHGISSIEPKDVGKWMLFYPTSTLDLKWVEFCSLYDESKLPGILSMKCSTSLKNSRSSNDSEGVIILYCNNSSNETEILNIGNRLVPYIQDYLGKTIYYKTNIQTRAGTIATGSISNHTYKITIEKPILITSYPLPFFPDYTIDIPSSYNGGRDLTGITIKNKKGKTVKPTRIPTGSITWVLKNPDSSNKDYQTLYHKNVVGYTSQSLYDSDIRAIYTYLKSNSLKCSSV